MGSMREDYLLRMIGRAFEVLRRILLRRQAKEFHAAAREADGAVDDLLGPLAAVATRLDATTAAQLLRDPERVTLWARLLAEKAEALREDGRDPLPTGRRALETALEAWLLEDDQRRLTTELRGVLADTLGMARGWADPADLSPRHRDALDGATRSLRGEP